MQSCYFEVTWTDRFATRVKSFAKEKMVDFWKMIRNLTESAETRYNKGKLEMCFSKMYGSRTDTEVTVYKDLQKMAVFFAKEEKQLKSGAFFQMLCFSPVQERISKDTVATGHYRLRY